MPKRARGENVVKKARSRTKAVDICSKQTKLDVPLSLSCRAEGILVEGRRQSSWRWARKRMEREGAIRP